MTSLPQHLGGYEVLHALKAGGMGEVLLARRRGLGGFEQLCAIKTIRPELAGAPVVRTMFLDEARLLARLTHPAIAQILDFGEADGTVFMVMEYVAGEHFRRFAERRPPAPIVCQAVAAACRGLHAAHELRDVGDGHLLGVVHRDISPDNLMLGFDGRVKVLDFGIALVKGRQAPATELGVLKGKPPYMSPEQLRNHELDRRADVFSVSVVLHELLTGRHLFTGDSIYAVVHAVEHQVIEPPSKLVGRLPGDLDDLVMAGLERDRDRRLRSAAAMAEVLERIAAQSGGESLEAWAERELIADRDAHRQWMAAIMAGAGSPKVGRPTGIVTALAEAPPGTPPGALAAPMLAPPTTDATDVDPQVDAIRATQLADVSAVVPSTASTPANPIARPQTELAPPTRSPTRSPTLSTELSAASARSRRGLAIAAAVLAVAAIAVLLLVALGRHAGLVAVPADAADAALDGAGPVPVPVLDAAPADATVVIDLPLDAAPDAHPPRDAGPRPIREPVDAALAMRTDAAPAPRPDAGTGAAAATGTGFRSLGAKPYANVTVDGVSWSSTDIYKRPIPAGTHTVVFLDPVSGAEFYRKTLEVHPGEAASVIAPPRKAP
ncbi:MAG TPA: protein kinase [Kofleriaceae bacterium]|nr:protein kinase [Kofleriaceae bacterium]